ncbi:calcium-binding protein [Allosphingosinicella flava]|uniref:Calcium-binding protein n=1 Tax=Allosphingosinicella flava TaxID=2771430 RepID=A0A7T2GI26_9SPHN|nr:calcium-binding protein [Sphingosinicella flava]QPQ54253.1 calcium-binding protein [Sphingosinicella flava]
MKKIILSAATAALLTGGLAVAQPAPHGGDVKRADVAVAIDARAAKLDADRDGQITPGERQALRRQRIDGRFERLDTDKNGQLSKAEFQAAREKRGEAREGRHGKRGHFGGHGMRHGMGMRGAMATRTVSVADMKAKALGWFDRQDADRNGVVTQAERQQAMAARHAERQQKQ